MSSCGSRLARVIALLALAYGCSSRGQSRTDTGQSKLGASPAGGVGATSGAGGAFAGRASSASGTGGTPSAAGSGGGSALSDAGRARDAGSHDGGISNAGTSSAGAGGTQAGGGSGGAGGGVGSTSDAGLGSAAFWPSGTDGLDRSFANDFGTWRGRPATSNWINVHWVTWDWLTAPGLYSTLNGKDPVKVYDLYAGWQGVMVLSMSMAGSSNDSDYDQRMRECAMGNFDAYWQTFAKNASDAGRTGDTTVVSLAREFNGTWFKWNPSNVGLDVWTSCWRHVYGAIHANSSLRVAWVLSASSNTMKGGDYSVNTAWDAYPGDDYVDVVGINRYDFKSLSSATTTDWKDTCKNTQDICYLANFARQHKKALGVPEWSMDRGQYGWGDLPAFVQMMYGFFKDNADILAFENNFNNGGSGDWNFYPESSVNMSSAEQYKMLWKE